jgi:hypothetical protein
MRQFNKVISVEVSVDDIANQLLSTIAADFKHRELVAETIIGTSLEKGTLGYLYNSLNGYTNEINFFAGDRISCKSRERREYVEGEMKWAEIGDCDILEVNPYAQNKLYVRWFDVKQDGTPTERTQWVDHLKCSRLGGPEVNNAKLRKSASPVAAAL